jgi:hypothetical protein
MGLTKPRAAQIYDIDYKQATRVLTASNITLSGGAPSQVDGVNLSLDDRVLVIGQTTQSQNGIYFVDVLGSGSNGTWVRTGDTDLTGELLAGTIVMVTEGIVYHDTQWKLITDNPIIIGTTALVFEQNSAFAFGNVYANGTAVLATSVGDVLTLTAGNNIQITGNNTSKSVTIGVTGISLNSISNGTSNVNVVSSGGNVTVGVGGTDNVAVFSSGGLAITGNITGNGSGLSGINAFSNVTVTGGNSAVADSIADTLTLTAGDGITIVIDPATDTITFGVQSGSEIFVDGADFGTVEEAVTLTDDLGLVTDLVDEEADLGSIVTSGVIYPDLLVIGDINDFQVFGGNNGQYLGTAGNGVLQWQTLSAPLTGDMIGNINGNSYSITSLSTLQATGNVTGGNLVTAGAITATGNVTGGNVLTGGVISAASTVTSAANITGGNITTAGQITATGNATAGNLITAGLISATSTITSAANITGANLLTSGLLTATGNITGGNILTGGLISATGNVSAGNLIVTGNIVDTAALSILSGANGNITLNPNGTGVVISTANTIPSANATYDLGSTTARWRTVFTSDLDLNNGIGDWTIVEGEDDLFLYNNKKGRVYKFALIEVDPATATPKIDGLK